MVLIRLLTRLAYEVTQATQLTITIVLTRDWINTSFLDFCIINFYLPFLGMNFSLYISSTAGIKNAKVFPLPVFAAPSRSLKQSRH